MKKLTSTIIRIFIIFIILFSFFITNSYALVKQSYDFFVNDTSNILNKNTKQYIIDINKKLENQTGAQIVVVTVKSLDGLSIEDYATQLFRKYRYW